MGEKNSSIRYKKSKIRKLLKENEEIDSFLYPVLENDLDHTIYNLKYKREQKIRSFIIEFHLSFENTLDYWIREFLIKNNPRIKKKKGDVFFHKKAKFFRYADSLLEGRFALNFSKKLLLVRSMGLIDDRYYEKLKILNNLRDACSHAWILDEVIRKGRKRHKKKKTRLEYKGKNLLKIAVFKNFTEDYKNIYLRTL